MRLIPKNTEFVFARTKLHVRVTGHNTVSGEVECRVISPPEREGHPVDFRDTFLVNNAERLTEQAADFARRFRAEQVALEVRKARGLVA